VVSGVFDVVIVKAIIKGTIIEVTFKLTPEQYIHYEYLRGQRVDESMPMDQNIIGEIAALLEHLE